MKSGGFPPADLSEIPGPPGRPGRAGEPLHDLTGGDQVGDMGVKLLNMGHNFSFPG